MGEVSTIGVDIAKSVFQIHGVDAGGTVVIRRRVGRARVLEFFADLPPCLVGMEACATAHQWAGCDTFHYLRAGGAETRSLQRAGRCNRRAFPIHPHIERSGTGFGTKRTFRDVCYKSVIR